MLPPQEQQPPRRGISAAYPAVRLRSQRWWARYADEMSAPTVASNCPCWSKDGFFRDNPDYVKKDQSLPECRPRDTLFKSIFLPQPTKIWMRWRKSLPELGSNWTEVIALCASTQSSGGMSCVERRALRRDMLLSELVASSFSPMHRCTARARQPGSGRLTETLWPCGLDWNQEAVEKPAYETQIVLIRRHEPLHDAWTAHSFGPLPLTSRAA